MGMNSRSTIKWIRIAIIMVITVSQGPLHADPDKIGAAVDRFQENCVSQAWQIWPVPLCGPLLFVEPQTRQVIATETDTQQILKKSGRFYTGTLPDDVMVANTSVDWSGKKWIMIMLPLPKTAQRQDLLIAHEAFHSIQDKIGVPANNPANSHLSDLDGKFLMLLEYRALQKALKSDTAARQSLIDALTIRAKRHQTFDGSTSGETALERNEGLAEYTGRLVTGYTTDEISNVLEIQDYSAPIERTFAYKTGPAYGYILDSIAPDWRQTIDSSFSFSQALDNFFPTSAFVDNPQTWSDLLARYEGQALKQTLLEIEEKRQAEKERLIAMFSVSPTLRLPLKNMQMQFDPNRVKTVDGLGTLYPGIVLTDAWGKAKAGKYALIDNNYRYFYLPISGQSEPQLINEVIQTPDWSISVKGCWALKKVDSGYHLIPCE